MTDRPEYPGAPPWVKVAAAIAAVVVLILLLLLLLRGSGHGPGRHLSAEPSTSAGAVLRGG